MDGLNVGSSVSYIINAGQNKNDRLCVRVKEKDRMLSCKGVDFSNHIPVMSTIVVSPLHSGSVCHFCFLFLCSRSHLCLVKAKCQGASKGNYFGTVFIT